LVCAPELPNTEIQENFLLKRKEVNSTSSKRAYDKGFENLRKFATICWAHFFKLSLSLLYAWLQKLVKKSKIGLENHFLPNVCGICKEKNSESVCEF
jgi:hypothetical protein